MSDYLMCAALLCVQVHLFKIPCMGRSKIVDAHTVDANVVIVSYNLLNICIARYVGKQSFLL
jgi:hypothetical protein